MTRQADSRTVLLVEDNELDRDRIRRMLHGRRRSYDLTECATGAEALAALADGRHFDCVLIDHHLPDMDGTDLLRRLRQGERLPVAVSMLTAFEDDEVATCALSLGAEDYLLKDSLTADALVRSIENVQERFEIRRQLDAQRAAADLRNERLLLMRDQLAARLEELSAATQARDRFIAMMSHEMRTPLNAILGYAELLEMEIEGQINEGQRRNLERIRVGSRHLLDLINDVLDLARADARKLELDARPIDVRATVEEVAALLDGQASQAGLTLSADVPPSLPFVNADLQRLRQILTNLIGNAIKFTPKGSVHLAASVDESASRVRIAVSDTGIGIDPAIRGDIFKEFFQADNALTRPYGGSGLGLAISQRLARAMGGDITVESDFGSGSTFTLTLPVAAAGSVARESDATDHQTRMRRHAAQPAAPYEPVPVVAFADSEEALEALATHVAPTVRLIWTTVEGDVAAAVDREMAPLVILDIGSRNGAAWRAAHAVSEREGPNTSAILLLPEITTSNSKLPSGVDLGLVALVPKPFTSDQLSQAVSTAAGGTDSDRENYDVLVIDDDEDSRRVASRFLRERGMDVRECPDGETGLVEMRLRPPNVAVLDLMMPVLDGFGVLATMRADPLLASVPVVVLTAKTLTEAERQFLARTAARVLQKGEHRLADIANLVVRAASRSRQGGARSGT